MKPTAKLRQLLARDGLLIACGVYDALGAKIAEEAGYQVPAPFRKCSSMAGLKMSSSSMASSSSPH